MAVRVKPLDEMLRDVLASLQAGVRGRPVFTLLLGSGFSYPIVPTPSQMLRSDIAWWRYCKDRGITEPFCDRDAGVAAGLAKADEIGEFEQKLWTDIHSRCTGDETRRFPLADGLPDLSDPENVGRAYDAVMSEGLLNNRMRRQYLRDAIARSGRKVNGAHIYLAGVLEAQERWEWGAPFCRAIFTTNFDPLLQRSLQLVNKLYYMTDRPEVLDAPDDDRSDAIHLVYTHGSVHRYELLNTGEQIDKARRENAARLVDYFTRHGVIVMGYSGWRDTTMEALQLCSSFDSNLYWCDIHPADQADARLRPEVLEILRASEKGAWYVPIPSADEAMRQLHRALNLGDVPKFILAPVPTLIEQLQSIEVPAKAVSEEAADRMLAGNSMAELLSGTLDRLKVAQQAFDDPSVVKAVSAEAESDVARALIAQLMTDALVAHRQKKPEHAIALWSAVIATSGVPAADRAQALFNRGVMYDEIGKRVEEMEDYSAVIAMPDSPAAQKAKALRNRGIAYDERGDRAEAIDDFSAVIAMADAPLEEKAKAVINRGVTYFKLGKITAAVDDFSAAIAMTDVSAEMKAMALVNRGVAEAQNGRRANAIDDYSAVIAMADAPADQKVKALVNRGAVQSEDGKTANAIEDFSTVIAMPDAPAGAKAAALVGRGWRHFMKDGDVRSLIDDSRAALELVPANNLARANLGLGLLLNGDADGSLAEYERLLSQTSDTKVIGEVINDLRTEVAKHPDLAGAERVLSLLENAVGNQTATDASTSS